VILLTKGITHLRTPHNEFYLTELMARLVLSKQRRSKLEIYNDILNAIQKEAHEGEIKPTRIQHYSNMSYDKMSKYLKELESKKIEPSFKQGILQQSWHNIKSTLPCSSGGLHPGLVPYITKMLGNNCLLQLGGGIHGHPSGTYAGAKALRQALDATHYKIPLEIFAKHHKELRAALDKWGFSKPI